jgi:hypothetical protein
MSGPLRLNHWPFISHWVSHYITTRTFHLSMSKPLHPNQWPFISHWVSHYIPTNDLISLIERASISQPMTFHLSMSKPLHPNQWPFISHWVSHYIPTNDLLSLNERASISQPMTFHLSMSEPLYIPNQWAIRHLVLLTCSIHDCPTYKYSTHSNIIPDPHCCNITRKVRALAFGSAKHA